MPASSVDDYIAAFPPEVQELLQAVRATIRAGAPAAEERIGYGIPAYRLGGRPLIYFAGFRKHIGVYPAPRAHPELAEELAGYAGGKGTVQFPLGRPIPHTSSRAWCASARARTLSTLPAADRRPTLSGLQLLGRHERRLLPSRALRSTSPSSDPVLGQLPLLHRAKTDGGCMLDSPLGRHSQNPGSPWSR